jgi:hypothetical protein
MANPNYSIDIEANIENGKYEPKTPYIRGDKANNHARRVEENNLHYNVFREDLFAAEGVTGHPKAKECFDIAWNERHSYGLKEVASFFETIVVLIKD